MCSIWIFRSQCETGRAIGFVTHMDTAPDASGKDVKPWVLENYDGKDIVLNAEKILGCHRLYFQI